ncbi:MAG TPA: MoaD/ThiS family protein [Methylomirabilota bacterium]|nr:MoaD/ThiS family protein [Methylomirabilota bacterium]
MESRRGFLRWLVYSTIGAGLFLAAGSLTELVSAGVSEQHSEKTFRSTVLVNAISNSDRSFISIKVVYTQMAQYINASDEYFALQDPATVRDLLGSVVQRHPILSSMMGSMWIMINGAPSRLGDFLKDGDEVDFLPLMTGG